MNPNLPPVYSSDPTPVDPNHPGSIPTGPNLSGVPGATSSVSARPLKVQSPDSSLIKTIVIILLSLLTVGAMLLAFYFFTEYRAAKTDVDAQIDTAVETVKKRLIDEKEKEFEAREKTPYSVFYGPEDYGGLSFEYPKTWSLYVESSPNSSNSRDEYRAYLHPRGVQPLSPETVHALEVTIQTADYSTLSRQYENNLKKGELTSSVVQVGGQNADRYDGKLPSNLIGSAVTFKIRDKVVTLQTDAEIYREDFDEILKSVKFNL